MSNTFATISSNSMLMNEKSARLMALRKFFGYTQSAFAAKINTKQSNIARYESGNAKIGDDFGFKLISVFGLNETWWETGEGDMFKSGTPMSQQMGDTKQIMGGPRGVSAYIPEKLIKIPLVDINARAGLIENLDNYQEYISDYAFIEPERGVKYDNALAINIDGDSMEPGLQRGDRVMAFFQENAEWEYLNPGIYAIVYRNSFVIKRIMKNTLQSTGTLELISDNDIHGPITVKIEDIKAIWKVSELIKRRLF